MKCRNKIRKIATMTMTLRNVRLRNDIVEVKTKAKFHFCFQKLPPKTTEISHLLNEKIEKFGV